MKFKNPDEKYLEQAKQLSDLEAERLLSRMGGKLPRRLEKEKLTRLEALALQLELEDEQLEEWRKRMADIREQEQEKTKEKKAKG